ncbi:MAG: hypothetical protein IPO08_22865 [Xanthomonadales bacterium]|nr:hypothetical protein [Xanthomonadales bacterium]
MTEAEELRVKHATALGESVTFDESSPFGAKEHAAAKAITTVNFPGVLADYQ